MAVIVTRDIETPLGKMRVGACEGALVFALWLTGEPERVERIIARTAGRCRRRGGLAGQLVPHRRGRGADHGVPRGPAHDLRASHSSSRHRLSATRLARADRHQLRLRHHLRHAQPSWQGCEAARAPSARPSAANPLHVIIPCHRVVEKSGRIGGYAGGGAVKFELLAREGKVVSVNAVPGGVSRDSSPTPSRR